MSEVMYRTFRFTAGSQSSMWPLVKAFWRSAVCHFLGRGETVLLILTNERAPRNRQQNARLWGHLYRTISEQAWVNGQQFAPDVWHEYFARKYGVCDEVILPDGEIVSRRRSTTEMTTAEFSEFMDRIETEAATELGVSFA